MGHRFLVTAGSTREPIDEVRDWGNIFTGGTGYGIARALLELGAVHLLTSNAEHADAFRQAGGSAGQFRTHAELRRHLQDCMTTCTWAAVVMCAAVGDYTPAGAFSVESRVVQADGSELWCVRGVQAGKVPGHHDHIAILGDRSEKLIDLFRTPWRHAGLLVKFKLEVGRSSDELLAIGRASRRHSDADLLVANTLAMTTGENAGAWLIDGSGERFVSRATLPAELVEWIARRVTGTKQD